MSHIRAKFRSINFDCLLDINEQIVPRFVLEFYCQLTFTNNSSGQFVVNFVIQNKPFSLTLEEFGEILKIPFKGHASITEMWSLDHLSVGVPTKGLYKTKPPSPRVIKSHIQIPRQGQETRTKNKVTIVVGENEILTREIRTHMKPWVEIIRENVFCQGGHKDHVSACLCHMLYCIETSTPYNLAFFILKRMERTRFKPKELLPYGMLLTRLFKHVVSISPELAFDHYLSHDRAMHPLAPHHERKTRADRGKKRPCEPNASSSSTTQNPSSSSHMIEPCIRSLLIMSGRHERIKARKDHVSQMLAPPQPLKILLPHLFKLMSLLMIMMLSHLNPISHLLLKLFLPHQMLFLEYIKTLLMKIMT
ncbi:hypothetical protein Tco_0183399 [Tanacetum coccineum]